MREQIPKKDLMNKGHDVLFSKPICKRKERYASAKNRTFIRFGVSLLCHGILYLAREV